MDVEAGSIELDLGPSSPGRYLGEVEPDGTVVLRPATVITTAQATLLAYPALTHDIDAFTANPTRSARKGRPVRGNGTGA